MLPIMRCNNKPYQQCVQCVAYHVVQQPHEVVCPALLTAPSCVDRVAEVCLCGHLSRLGHCKAHSGGPSGTAHTHTHACIVLCVSSARPYRQDTGCSNSVQGFHKGRNSGNACMTSVTHACFLAWLLFSLDANSSCSNASIAWKHASCDTHTHIHTHTDMLTHNTGCC